MHGHVCTFVISVIFIFHDVQSKVVQGELKTFNNWKFITRFCFKSRDGTLEYEFQYPEKYLTQNLLLYWDGPQIWPAVYRSSLSCAARKAKLSEDYLQIFRLSDGRSNCNNFNGTIYCKSKRIPFMTIRARWWYLVVSNCAAKEGMELRYKIWMRNSKPGDAFREHFSADEFPILPTNIGFLMAEIIIFIICIVFAVMLNNKNMFHSTYRMFFASVAFRVAYLLFSCIRWGSYGRNGVDNSGLGYFADALAAISLIIFIMMLLLMALGYTIICGRLPTWMIICLCVFMFALIVTYIVLFIYEALIFDPGWVLYRYESKPGLGLMGVLICSWLVFTVGGIFTMVAHKRKRDFFIPFLIFYSVWFWAVPAMVFIAINHMALWMRMGIVNGVENGIIFCGHLFYLILTRPTDGNHNFPYHIRTQQIDAITLQEATDKALENMEASNARTFNPDIFTVSAEPSRSNSRPQHADSHAMFTVAAHGTPSPTSLNHADGDREEVTFRPDTAQPDITPGEDFYVPRNIDSMFSFPPAPSAPGQR